MASSTLIPIESYLAKYVDAEHPPEYVHGELVPRPMPNWLHSRIQGLLFARLQEVGLAATELHLRVTENTFRIADIAMYRHAPDEEIPSTPPMVVVEVISPDETHQGLLRKLREYDTFQVPHIWVVEPQLRSFHVYQKGTLREVSAFEIPELNFQIDAVRLFAEATSR